MSVHCEVDKYKDIKPGATDQTKIRDKGRVTVTDRRECG